MRRELQSRNWDAGQNLRELVRAFPWLGIALIYLLSPEQWKALKSGKVFEEIREHLVRMARFVFRDVPGDLDWKAEDAADNTLCKLASRDFLRRYDAEKGPPKPFTLSVGWRYLHADRRSAFTLLRREGLLPEGLEVTCHADPATQYEHNDMFDFVLTLVEELTPEQRDAIKKRFLETQEDGNASPPADAAECVQRCRGLKKIRGELRNRGLLE